MTFASGRIYEGQFAEGAPNGQGKLTVPDECVYEGTITYHEGVFRCEGKRTLSNGTVEEGVFGGDGSKQ